MNQTLAKTMMGFTSPQAIRTKSIEEAKVGSDQSPKSSLEDNALT